MQQRITVRDLFETLQERLGLRLMAGRNGLDNCIFEAEEDLADRIIASPLNFIHPPPIQIIGPTERKYLRELPAEEHQSILEQLFFPGTAAVLLSNRQRTTKELREYADKTSIPLLTSTLTDSQVLDNLQYYSARIFAEEAQLHGVFLDVLGMGVLLTGHSAVGKSELALELITRGHSLIADDITQFRRVAPDIISGSCPTLLREFLEIRGLGILNIPAMFGDSSIKNSKYLQLIIHLKRMKLQEIADMQRLRGNENLRRILGVDIPEITIPVAPGRNLAILVETAVRNYLLKLKGYDAAELFIEKQAAAIAEEPA